MSQDYRSSFSAPIPGQSLTAELGERPWQHPPQYPTVERAAEYYAERILNMTARDQLVEVMESGIPLTTIANALQGGSVMEGKHTIDVGILMMPIIVEMLSYVGDEEEADYVVGIEPEQRDTDKFSSSAISKVLREMKDDLANEDGVEEMPMEPDEEVEPAPAGLMARR